jgi:Pyruvate/2-oxoacid:ferredoxin oxidoreductase delta subunit
MISRRVVLHFPPAIIDKPITCQLVKDYGITFNILKANITPNKEGLLILEVSGKDKDVGSALAYLKGLNIQIDQLAQDIKLNDEKCTQCGVCTVFCPTDALEIDRATMEVSYDAAKCIACEACVKVCPTRAIEVYF